MAPAGVIFVVLLNGCIRIQRSAMNSQHGRQVSVFVRTRPTANFAQEFIEYLPDGQTVNVYQRRCSRKVSVRNQLSPWSFQLDGVLHDLSQEEVYARVGRGVVLRALEGYNGTVMCFGQTGAGKTYTMTGATESYKQRGIIPRALQEVFQELGKRSDHAFSLLLSYLEIYNETLVDLLASVRGGPGPGAMAVVEEPGGGVSVRGLSLHAVHSEEEALNLLFEGEMNRIIGGHTLNRNSSRSHCILTVHIESRKRTLSDAKYVTSKLNLVDLAGSERLGKTGSEGQGFKEATYINKSLSFLEQTILALADRRRNHVPFRQTKLTHALKDSLGGNCNTVLVANVYGEAAQIEETLSTLRFASRMKCVRTNPAVNEHLDPALHVKKLQKEIQILKQELSIHNTLANRPCATYETLSEAQVAEIQRQVQRYLEGSLEEINIISIRQVKEVFAQFKLAVEEREQKLKAQPYSWVEENQSASSATVKRWESKGNVGEVEGGGFGVGVAAPSERHVREAPSPGKAKAKMTKETAIPSQGKTQRAASPGIGKPAETASKSKLNALQATQKEQGSHDTGTQSLDTHGPQDLDKEPARTHSPPPKAEAFEDFKVERGSEINRILKENKAVLLERRTRLRQLTDAVNEAKREIDSTSASLQHYKDMREAQGQFVSAEGDPVLDEPEVTQVLRLRELKARYREQHEELRSTKVEVNYCQHLVDQCRIRLLTEFESWYNESFLLPEEVQAMLRAGGPVQPRLLLSMDKPLTLEDDDQEHFKRLQYELIVDNPGAVSFYNARHKTLKRRNNRALSQWSSPRGSGWNKAPSVPPVT